MLTKRVVIWDPTPGLDRAADGTVVHGPRAAIAAESRGIVVLPVDAELLDRPPNGCSGWVKRSFGSGLPTGNDGNSVVGRRFAPVAFWVERDHGACLHWAARLVPAFDSRGEASGFLRLSADPTQSGVASAGLGSEGASVDVAALGPADRRGGWTVLGRQSLASFSGGFFGLSLYGTARGVAVAWVAVSQARD